MQRIRVGYSGNAVVGPGVATFYNAGSDAAALRAALAAFYDAFDANLPTSLIVTIPSTGDLVDVETGEVTGVWSDGTPTLIGGDDPGAFAAGVGARVVWETNARTNRRRVRGSTFIVPLGAGAYGTDGTLDTIFRQRLVDGANALLSGLGEGFTIWTRPVDGAGGKGSVVVGATVPDKVTTLRSRRV